TAAAQTIMVSTNFSTTTLESIVSTDAALVRSVVNTFLRPDDLDPETLSQTRRDEIEANLAVLVRRAEVLRIELRLPDGRVILSDRPGLAGSIAPPTAGFRAAVDHQTVTAGIDDVSLSEASGPTLGTSSVLREYFPLQASGRVQAVVALWRDAVPILAKLDEVRRDIVTMTLVAALVAAFVLFLVFRAAQGRITRQTAALMESTRLDPLTGLLNHGSLVGELALALEGARTEQRAIGVALVDLDGFRLLNETYGHAAGDRALMTVAATLRAELPATMIWGRYGPDEFLVIAPAALVAELRPVLERLRARLADGELRFEASERLPISVSAGICIYPEHADSVTALLTTVALTLQEARSGGGDAIRFAGNHVDVPAEAHTFDVFQGLVLAVDTKDRYTKRHSEDVARYAVFLGHLAGLDEATLQTLRVAGLLHDVGKIGVPDHILRKPGKLTGDEYRTVQQHVALGDTIIRDLPDVDLIRAGVRHHHERWDGAGYLHGLTGEEIPLIARMLAIGDAFSAMTTTRPYRKALPITEALRRLEDAAGTQLDEHLVTTFVAGIEADGEAVLPAGDARPALWTPYSRVA
ncbi:MAG: bifunctional diguanylate cyclase/phosphohydrolase, partial [Candidatus Limnocylindrales bacterium]